MKQSILFLNIFLAGLIAGIVFGIWIGYNPQDLSAETYVEQQQNAIRHLNVIMPILGFISMLLALASAAISKEDKVMRNLLLLAVALFIVSGLVTRFGNQPINAVVITWDPRNTPEIWIELRDKWWTFHIIRTITTLIGFAIIVWATVRNKATSTSV